MAPEKTSKELIGEALEESEYETEEHLSGHSWDEWDAEGAEETPDPSKGEPVEPVVASEDPKVVTEEDVPEIYWGTDLSGIPAEKRAEIIAHLEQQDNIIHKLQTDIAAAKENTAPPVNEEPKEFTDADILRAIGVPEDELEFADPRLVTLGRSIVSLEEKVDSLSQNEAGRAAESYWNKTLNELEESYGKLPHEREDVLRYALSEGINTPFELYFRVQAPVKAEVEKLAAEARRVGLKKEAKGGLKTRSATTAPPTITSNMSMKEAVTRAAKQAEEETGFRFRDAVKRRLVKTQE